MTQDVLSRRPRGDPLRRGRSEGERVKIEKGLFPWAASGRATANGRDEDQTKPLFDAGTHRIISGGRVGTHAGDLISELAIEMAAGAEEVTAVVVARRAKR